MENDDIESPPGIFSRWAEERILYETWIDDPWNAWIGWENGPWIQHNAFHVLLEQWYPDEYEKVDRKQKGFKQEVAKILFRKGYLGPTLRVHQFKIESIDAPWPPKSHTSLYGKWVT